MRKPRYKDRVYRPLYLVSIRLVEDGHGVVFHVVRGCAEGEQTFIHRDDVDGLPSWIEDGYDVSAPKHGDAYINHRDLWDGKAACDSWYEATAYADSQLDRMVSNLQSQLAVVAEAKGKIQAMRHMDSMGAT